MICSNSVIWYFTRHLDRNGGVTISTLTSDTYPIGVIVAKLLVAKEVVVSHQLPEVTLDDVHAVSFGTKGSGGIDNQALYETIEIRK